MALDNALKRLSAVQPGCPWRPALPLPDGVVEQADRQVVGYLYAGISADTRTRTRMLLGMGV